MKNNNNKKLKTFEEFENTYYPNTIDNSIDTMDDYEEKNEQLADKIAEQIAKKVFEKNQYLIFGVK